MARPFRLTVLGQPELHTPEGERVRVRTRKHLALLIYLAVEPPAPHRRDKLATLLWPQVLIDEARHSLATGLTILRARLGREAFDNTRDTVRLTPDAVSTDLRQLGEDNPSDLFASPLGRFLEEFEIDDAPDFQQWAEAQSSRLLPVLHTVLVRRIDHARRHGDSRRMADVAERLRRIDPLNEEATRALVETRATAGDRIGALRVFDAWRTELAESLGASPSPAIERIIARLRRGKWDQRSPAALAPVVAAQTTEQTFIGRGAEFATCYAAWERARDGEPRHVLVRGDSGIGKTTLMERVVASIVLEGAAVARTKCYELERELPFGMVGGLVNHLLDLPGAGTTPPEQLAELGRLVQKVRQRYPSLPDPIPSIGESARLLFTEAVMALIEAIAGDHPVVLVVDDIHLSDATSLAVLHLLLRRINNLPLMVMLSITGNDPEPPEVHRFVERPDSIALAQVQLGPFNESESNQLLEALIAGQDRPGATVHRAIVAGARGNPMVLELLLLDWRRRGDECLALALGAMTSTQVAPLEEAFRQVVNHTIAALDPQARSVAELGAILGQRLNDLAMYSLVDLPVARTMRAMTDLTAHRILRDAGTTLEFANDFVRGQCYLAMAAPLRRMLHGAVANRLLDQDGASDPIPGLEIAWHLVRADRLPEAVPFLLAGGREAIRRAAPHEADLALSTGLPALTGASRRTAILLLAEAQQELGRWEDSLRLLDGADEPFDESELACREVYRVLAMRWVGSLAPADMISATNDLLRIAVTELSLEVRVKALTASVRVLALTRDRGQLQTLREVTDAMSTLDMEPFDALHFHLASAWLQGLDQHTMTALEEVRSAIKIAEDAKVSSSITARLFIGEGNLLSMSGRYDEAAAPLQRALALCGRLDNASLKAECTSQLAVAEGRLGNSGAQVHWAQVAMSLIPPNEWGIVATSAAYELGLGLVSEGKVPEATRSIDLLSTPLPTDIPPWVVQARLLCAADVALLAGHGRRAHSFARRATSSAMAILQNPSFAGQFVRWITLLALRNDGAKAALTRIRESFPDLHRLDSKDRAEVLLCLALLQDELGIDTKTLWADVHVSFAALPQPIESFVRKLGLVKCS
ncbi:MAG: ATP-binding protein [Gemmatimonadales bacterium]